MATSIDYLKLFIQRMENETQKIMLNNQTFKLIQNSVNQWLTKANKLKTSLNYSYTIIQKMQNLTMIQEQKIGKSIMATKDLHAAEERYFNLKRHISNLRTMEDIHDFFKDGYKLIHYIRELITKQNIVYTISVTQNSGDYSGQNIMEVTLSLAELMNNVKIEVNSSLVVEDVIQAYEIKVREAQIRNAIYSKIEQRKEKLTEASFKIAKPDLWDSLISNNTIEQNVNFGNIYEAYKTLSTFYPTVNYIGDAGDKNTIGLGNSIIKQALKNTDAGWKIGDLGLEQYKSIVKSSATLINMSKMERVLNDTKTALNQPNTQDIANELQKIYTVERESFNNKIDTQVNQIARKNIEETVNQFNLT